MEKETHDPVPLVSIGMPVYNAEAYVEEAIDALLAQSFTDFELIISDNASTDRTRAICEAYAAADSRVRYFPLEENLGVIRNFNRLFDLASGKYFKWASGDDICAPQFLERCVEVLEQDPDVAWCHTRSRHIDESGQPLDTDTDEVISYAVPGSAWEEAGDAHRFVSRESPRVEERFRSVLLGYGGVLDSYGLIRSDIIAKTPLYLPYFGSEKVFMAELALRGSYREVPEVLLSVRVHSAAAYNIRSTAEQREFIDPKGRRRFAFTRLKLLNGYLSAIMRAELTPGERLRCLAIVLQYLLQFGKWKRIFLNMFSGRGMVHDHK